MKKYMITGIAALALGASFVSCSKEDNLYDPNLVAINEKGKAVAAYNNAFMKAFGQPAANQDWGFGIKTADVTRAYVSAEGNPEKYFYANACTDWVDTFIVGLDSNLGSFAGNLRRPHHHTQNCQNPRQKSQDCCRVRHHLCRCRCHGRYQYSNR